MAFDKNLAAAVAEAFQAKKQARGELVEKRRNELYEKIPTLRDLEKEIASVSFKTFLKVADGYDAEKAAKSIKEEVTLLTEKRDNLIISAGFPRDYLNPSYDCPLCKDEGFLNDTYCNCFKKELVAKTFAESNLATLSGNSFSDFSLDYYSDEAENGEISPRKNMEKIFSECKKFADNFETIGDNLLLTGPSGLGKTFLSSCIASKLINDGVNVIYQSAGVVFSLLDRIKFSKNATEADSYTAERLLDSDLLILDDLGTEFITEFSVSELFRILNTRALTGKKTVINTNLSLSDLKKIYSERILSRIIGNFVILKFYGKDIRFLKKM